MGVRNRNITKLKKVNCSVLHSQAVKIHFYYSMHQARQVRIFNAGLLWTSKIPQDQAHILCLVLGYLRSPLKSPRFPKDLAKYASDRYLPSLVCIARHSLHFLKNQIFVHEKKIILLHNRSIKFQALTRCVTSTYMIKTNLYCKLFSTLFFIT